MFHPDQLMTFTLYSYSHIAALMVFLMVLLIMICSFQKWKNQRGEKIIGWLLFSLLAGSEIFYQIWAISYGVWDSRETLPLHLCSFSTFFGIYLYFKKNNILFYFYFYIGFIPPILALITPDLLFEFPHFRYFKFFIQHMAIPLMAVFLLITRKYTLSFKSIIYGVITLNLMIFPIGLINRWIGSNYFFLAGPPKGDTVLTFFGKGIVYYINLEFAAFLLFFISFLCSKWIIKFQSMLEQGVNVRTYKEYDR
ncbi:putative integral membrane protein (TIGR02206 family) [Bacillus pakistanensis]|uniref:Integral membrane protein (TIGR02206 family) n=1 Tax=Rossellomorea pakistanensis TaxID=992288 RepID=A0ABS2N8J1_9BACI|nr:TIGR02206 family membrane protein [Bacillus pakistanensis]MBM7584178.1 putative integral membrane protein (TIGR02206 family) [Bacillus pakistanensis]